MKSTTKLTFAALGCVGLAGLALWWLADHRRGIAWAVSVVRDRFPDVSHLPPASLNTWLRYVERTAPQLVDARSEEEFAVSHLPGARRIDSESTASAALSALDPSVPPSSTVRRGIVARLSPGASRMLVAVTCGISKVASSPGPMPVFH